ncbi:MAG TPA: flagellar motor protein MotB [Terriglobia bacterium]|nr:flagellar motor protein MotB [Terriglobia bacterium]
MARKKKHAEHVNHERWLVSYADFITLLFAFFVVMFAASNSDHKKAGQVAQAVQGAFHDLALFEPSGKVIPLYDEGGVPSTTTSIVGNMRSGFTATEVVPAGGRGEASKAATIPEVKAQIEKALKEQLENKSVSVKQDERGLTISLSEAGFFAAGSAVMQPKGADVLQQIVANLMPLPNPVRVEGHTDNTPIHTAQFPSNWELSTARATHVLQFLIESKIPPERMSAVGYGEYRPVASNNDVEGRATNRRVDVVILGDTAQKIEPH